MWSQRWSEEPLKQVRFLWVAPINTQLAQWQSNRLISDRSVDRNHYWVPTVMQLRRKSNCFIRIRSLVRFQSSPPKVFSGQFNGKIRGLGPCVGSSILPPETSYLGAVVGYGLPLQGRCLEGFDFLGLHQIMEACQSLVYWNSLENCRSRNRSVSSNLTVSANALLVYWYYSCLVIRRSQFDSSMGHQIYPISSVVEQSLDKRQVSGS